MDIVQILAVIFAGVAVGIADALLKKIAIGGSCEGSLKSPWMILIGLLYLAQIIFFAYVFSHHWKLGVVGNLQMVFYSLTVVLVGFFMFKETLSGAQLVGIGLALAGIFLINK